MALLQPPPEVFNLFDDVLLLSEGQVVYHGPREEVMPFFNSLGFDIPPRKGVADFLQVRGSQTKQLGRLSWLEWASSGVAGKVGTHQPHAQAMLVPAADPRSAGTRVAHGCGHCLHGGLQSLLT